MKGLFTSVLLIFLISVLTTGQLAAQEKGNGKLSGTIIDSSNNQPVEFATVALIDPATNKPVDGTVADEKGKFQISGIAAGTYRLNVSFIGYETYTQDVAFSDKRSSVDLGVVKLGATVTQLNEVVVEGERSLVEEKVDRMIYNAENDATARGGDATDVLRRVPMLTVDMDGNVSMRGNQNILVLINNKPSTITASSVADALKQIPADQIKSVEVITSPSAKYDAEGSAGIINIITKKNNMQGFTFNVDTNVGLRGSHLGLNSNLRFGKMGFSLGGWGRANYNVTGNYMNNQTTFDASRGVETMNTQQATTLNQGLFGNYNLGWDYDINKYNSLVASVRIGARNGKNFQDDLLTQAFENGSLVRSSLRNVNTSDQNGNVDANLTYTRTFETTGKEFSVMGSLSRNNRTNDFINDIYEENGLPTFSSIKNNNKSYNQETTIQADYQTPIGDKQIVEFGAKNISRIVSSKYQYFTAAGDGEYVLNPNATLSNNLDYNQNVASGYLSYTATLPKGYSLKAGTRYEYTTISANFQDEAEINIPSYGVLVPSANLSKKLKTGTVKAAYNRRIQRPSLRYLNPNIQGSNPLNVTQGDPLLSPEYTNNYELAYSTYFKKSSLNFSVFARNTNNAIQDVRDVRGDTIRTTFQNIGREDSYGSSIFMNISLSDKFTLNGGTDFYYRVLDNQNPDPIYAANNTGFVISGRMFGNYNISKVWAVQFFGFMRGRDVQLQGWRSPFGMYSLSFRREFGDKRGSIGFGAENFFNVNGFTIRSQSVSPILTQRSTNVMNNMSFKVNFSLRLGKMSFDPRPGRNRSINNDDLKQGGDGGMDGGDGGQGPGGQGGRGGFGGFNGQRGQGQRGQGQRPATATVNPNAAKADPNAVVDPTGTWEYTLESPQGGSGTIILKKEGDNYTGTITNARFNRENELKTVTLKGNEIEMSYEVNMGGNASTMTIKGTINENTLEGLMTIGTFGTFPVKATRR